MTKKEDAQNVKIAGLMHELAVLSDEMVYAMTQADPAYVARGRMTPHMQEVMEWYYAWAQRAHEAGL